MCLDRAYQGSHRGVRMGDCWRWLLGVTFARSSIAPCRDYLRDFVWEKTSCRVTESSRILQCSDCVLLFFAEHAPWERRAWRGRSNERSLHWRSKVSVGERQILVCRNPTLAKCGGEAQHLEKVRSWNPPRLPNVQSSIVRGKTPRIEVFLVSLERSWNVDIENALAFSIWTSVAQVMGKRRVGSQTGSLTPDH
jgi:hypothetical protein